MFKPSTKQQAIFDTWNNTDKNVLINAVAGSGKTTTLIELLKYCKYRTLFLAFNKSVQEEIQSQIDAKGLTQGKALTMHSLGLSAIRQHYKGKSKVVIKNGKNFELLKLLQAKHKSIFKYMKWEDKLKLSYTLMDMNDISRLFLTDNMDEIKKHLQSMDKNFVSHKDIVSLWASFVSLREKSYTAKTVVIDFNDMIYLAARDKLYIPVEPYYLMVDEAQDLNLAQHKLVENLIGQGTIIKWIAVGDRNQSIYGFSGAYSSSFNKFLGMGDVKELPLDICYRCAQSIIDETNEVYDVMEYGTEEKGIVGVVKDVNEIKPESMIICRNTSPIIKLYFGLLGAGMPVYIKGDDILTSITRFLKPYLNYTVGGAKIELQYKLEELQGEESESARIKLHIFKENYANFKALIANMSTDYEVIKVLLDKIKNLFKVKDKAVMLCTIHKSKGLEADIVYILNENLIPSKFATSPEQLTQEKNLKYVARSRAKKELYYLNL
jgi:DNA helicase-2/ATP-dependent DNA helicase PcrA